MKKILLTASIMLSSLAIISITASSFLAGSIGSIVCLCGVMTGISGLLVGGIVGGIEYSENKKNKDIDNITEIKSEEYIPDTNNKLNKKVEQDIAVEQAKTFDNSSEITK